MTQEKLKAANGLAKDCEYYQKKLGDIQEARSYVAKRRKENYDVVSVTICRELYIDLELVDAFLCEADGFYTAKKQKAEDEFAKL